MTMTTTPKDTFASIKPGTGEHAKYSPNLYRYLRKHCTFQRKQWIFKDQRGTLWIGEIMSGTPPSAQGGFLGKRLFEATSGSGHRYCFTNLGPANLTLVEDFWPRYIQLGRCAIDPKHNAHFEGDRWQQAADGKSRSCLWCGHEQRREDYQHVEDRHRWVPA